MERKLFKNIFTLALEVKQSAHICVTHTNGHSLIRSWTHCTHICTQHPHTHLHRGSKGACFDKRIILLLTQPVPLKTKEESNTDTLRPSEGNNTQPTTLPPLHTHIHTHACCNDTATPCGDKKRPGYAVICASVCACQGKAAVRVNSYSHIRQVTANKRQEEHKTGDASSKSACWLERREAADGCRSRASCFLNSTHRSLSVLHFTAF